MSITQPETEPDSNSESNAPSSVPTTPVLFSQRKLLIRLFLCFQLTFALSFAGVLRITDEVEVFYQTQSLVERQSLAVPQAVANGHFFGKFATTREPYAPYGPGTAFFAIPHYLLGKAICAGFYDDSNKAEQQLILSFATGLSTSTYMALTLVLFCSLLINLGMDSSRAVCATLILGFATFLWTYGSCFYGEAMTCFCLTATAWAWQRSQQLKYTVIGLVFLSLAILCKAPLLIYAPSLVLWGLAPIAHKKRGPKQFVIAAIFVVGLSGWIHMWWNLERFAAPFEFGYDWSETVTGQPKAFSQAFLPALFGLTLSPGKGLIFYCPLLVLSFYGLSGQWQASRLKTLAWTSCLLTGLVFYGNYVFWAGGYCVGPRHLVPILPFCCIPAAFALWNLGRKQKWLWNTIFVFSVIFQFMLVQVSCLEDQALKVGAEKQSGYTYYQWDATRRHQPKNVYQLDYSPQLSYAVRLKDNYMELLNSEKQKPLNQGLNLWFWQLSKYQQRMNLKLPSATILAVLYLIFWVINLALLVPFFKLHWKLTATEKCN